MATQLTIQTPTALVVTPTVNTNPDSTGSYVVPSGIYKLLLRIVNTGTQRTITFDDPTSVTPAAATAFNPDLTVVVPATTGVRYVVIDDIARFVDPATGRISWTYDAALVGNIEVIGIA
jgi:uncharacterized heparinase superfamily protein